MNGLSKFDEIKREVAFVSQKKAPSVDRRSLPSSMERVNLLTSQGLLGAPGDLKAAHPLF